MILKLLKQEMLIPKEEYIINKRVNIRGTDVLLLSFTKNKDNNSLWFIYEEKEFTSERTVDDYKDVFLTNRDKLLDSIDSRSRNTNIHIKEMKIQDNILKFDSSNSSHIYNMNREGIMRLQHFVEKGLISEEWDEVKLENLVISQHKQREGDQLPKLDMTKDLNITLCISNDSLEIPIQHPFKVEFGKQDIGKKLEYYDEHLGKERFVFIDEIYSFNPYDNIKDKFEEIEDLEIRRNAIKTMTEALEKLYPRDVNIPVIKYETLDNIQLNFNMVDYLQDKPIINKSGVGIMWGSKDKEIGINGYKTRECVLQPIDKDITGQLELELFSKYIEIPEERIKI